MKCRRGLPRTGQPRAHATWSFLLRRAGTAHARCCGPLLRHGKKLLEVPRCQWQQGPVEGLEDCRRGHHRRESLAGHAEPRMRISKAGTSCFF
eukprot:CAMPEP_0206009800 /NCGR_PEP_ID=MMETSP1464-20131121/10388_1 /ASSEMBLY_ACC=CAM_ASM_001124 /TAXON_ID=119497 /ORGANISM="Exanthemachrysis gayraliae, Strain RCC1523" /LENGTH=92 /DNA_ID=CAMNT_0053383405 /DNA_START=413 /DNA_END=691 /DNA_ORIENTATION=+